MIGMGTNSETARLRTVPSRELNVPVGPVEAYVGGEHGEAAVQFWNTGRVLSYSRPSKFKNVSESVYLNIPARIARSLEPDLWEYLAESERKGIKEADRIIYGTYQEAMRGI